MTVKFIATKSRVVFGSCPYTSDMHSDIARKNSIPRGSVRGGGLADLTNRRIYGTSYGFGPYVVSKIQALLPGWQVDNPSDY